MVSANSNSYVGLTLNAAKRVLTQQFKAAGLGTPELEARILILSVTGLEHADLIANGSDDLSLDHAVALQQVADRRLSGEPIDHILGYRDFYGRRFKITKDVLSPRPETEGLLDAALKLYALDTDINCLDLGTGSGAIILSLLAERPHWSGVAVDLSEAALGVAKENAENLRLEARVKFIQTSWFDNIDGQFDLIVSNPPYIDAAYMEGLSPEVKNYDPALALYGGGDGLKAYRAIIEAAPSYLKKGGRVILEIGYDQGRRVAEILRHSGFKKVVCTQDLSGHDRILTAVWP